MDKNRRAKGEIINKSVTDVRLNFAVALNDAAYKGRWVVITRQDQPIAALISFGDLEELADSIDQKQQDEQLSEKASSQRSNNENLKILNGSNGKRREGFSQSDQEALVIVKLKIPFKALMEREDWENILDRLVERS